MNTRLFDLSHTVRGGMTTYPGIPGPRLGSHLTFEESRAVHAAGTEVSFTAVPPRIEGLATFPVRAFAHVPGSSS